MAKSSQSSMDADKRVGLPIWLLKKRYFVFSSLERKIRWRWVLRIFSRRGLRVASRAGP